MLKIFYQENGKTYSDFNLIEEAQKIINNYKNDGWEIVIVSTDNIINALRILVCRGKLSHTEVVFKYKDETIIMNEKGELSHYPEGFCDCQKTFLRELIEFKIGKKL